MHLDYKYDREYVQKLYIRVCRDSRFLMDYIQAVHFVAQILNTHALVIWTTMALDFDTMKSIAAGTHPCLSMERYRS